MHQRIVQHRAFTLIELLIVVVILGVLAAVIVPQFTDVTAEASITSARTQLNTMRSQIELYRGETGTYPSSSGANAGGDIDGNGSQDQWDDLIAENAVRSSPTWPNNFSANYVEATGELTLVLAAPFYDVNGDGSADSGDANFVAAW